jgi:hypothetical protein
MIVLYPIVRDDSLIELAYCGPTAGLSSLDCPLLASGGRGDAQAVQCRLKAVASKRLADRPLFRPALTDLGPNPLQLYVGTARRQTLSRATGIETSAGPILPVRRILCPKVAAGMQDLGVEGPA